MRQPPLIRTKDEVKSKIDLLEVRTVLQLLNKAGFPLGEFVRANKQKANVIGW